MRDNLFYRQITRNTSMCERVESLCTLQVRWPSRGQLTYRPEWLHETQEMARTIVSSHERPRIDLIHNIAGESSARGKGVTCPVMAFVFVPSFLLSPSLSVFNDPVAQLESAYFAQSTFLSECFSSSNFFLSTHRCVSCRAAQGARAMERMKGFTLHVTQSMFQMERPNGN